MPILETSELSRTFGELAAVDAVSFAVDSGEVFGLLGPNGAGKSTTIKMLTTLLPPTGGHAKVAGYDILREAPDVRRVIGYVPQALSADGNLTGYENLLRFATLSSTSMGPICKVTRCANGVLPCSARSARLRGLLTSTVICS